MSSDDRIKELINQIKELEAELQDYQERTCACSHVCDTVPRQNYDHNLTTMARQMSLSQPTQSGSYEAELYDRGMNSWEASPFSDGGHTQPLLPHAVSAAPQPGLYQLATSDSYIPGMSALTQPDPQFSAQSWGVKRGGQEQFCIAQHPSSS